MAIELKKFQVRDNTHHYSAPEFDVVFHDDENGVERYSDEVYATHDEALRVAEIYEATGAKPTHWEIYRYKL